jgi:hypothetical protein
MKPLSETPDEVRETLDDAIARTMLVQLGLLDRLLDLTRKPELPEPRADTMCDTNHSTHWILGIHYRGYPAAADNGYAVRCYPKSRYTLKQFRAAIRDTLGGSTPVDFQECWEGGPPPRHK